MNLCSPIRRVVCWQVLARPKSAGGFGMKRGRRKKNRGEQGVALIMVLLLILLLSTLATSLILITKTEIWSSYNYRLMTQSRYAAEAGAQQALNYLAYTYTGPTAAQL